VSLTRGFLFGLQHRRRPTRLEFGFDTWNHGTARRSWRYLLYPIITMGVFIEAADNALASGGRLVVPVLEERGGPQDFVVPRYQARSYN
jgi:hypothetical protein